MEMLAFYVFQQWCTFPHLVFDIRLDHCFNKFVIPLETRLCFVNECCQSKHLDIVILEKKKKLLDIFSDIGHLESRPTCENNSSRDSRCTNSI